MSRLTDWVSLRTIPASPDAALLWLRVFGGLSLFIKHGWEKPTHFAEMAQHFPDPIGIGPVPSLIIALIGDFVCSILMGVGLATRWAAAYAFVNILVAWGLVHHFEYLGKGGGADHGEVCVLYLILFAGLALAGAGRYSLDARLNR